MRRVAGTNSAGFSLVELLIVIGMIAVLIGLLLPMVTMAQRAAGQARCAGNLRQWAIAVNLYAATNHNWLPRRGQGKMPTGSLIWYDDWFNELPPLLGQPTYQELTSKSKMPQVSSNSIWICPQLTGEANRYGYLFGYAMNMALSVRETLQPDRIEKVGPTSTMVFMADGPPGYCSTVPFLSTPDIPALFNPAARHGPSSNLKVNLSFLDGHVQAYSAKYLGCGTAGDAAHKDGCNRPDVRWYWYVPGPSPAPWPGP